MKGGTCKRRKEPIQSQKEKTSSPSALFPVSESESVLSCSDSGLGPFKCTPRRCRKTKTTDELCKTSTPIQAKSPKVSFRISSPSSGKVQKTESQGNKSKPLSRRKSPKPRQIIKNRKQTCIKGNDINTKGRGSRKRKTEEEPSQRHRPRLNIEKSSAEEQNDSLPSSDLSIELSVCEEPPPLCQEDEKNDQEEEEEEEEELPSFSLTKPPSITKGGFVWYKFRNFPFWPAMVKSVNHKMKRASVLFVDHELIQRKRGFLVSLKTLKPFDCEEAKELVCKAKEKYDVAIEWSVELIKDYNLRKGCGSFSGSFIEYYAHDMSYPVRRKYQATSDRLTIASDAIMEQALLNDNLTEDSFSEQQDEDLKSSKRLLPDRTHAAHNRANIKLVHFIVKQRMVEEHLLAVMYGRQQSRWLRSFLSANRRRVVNIYLEDDQQLDQVYWYLTELFTKAVGTETCLVTVKSVDRVPFVLDVLLPEAIIYAIAGVDKISIKKAEEKYLKGRCISNRERQEFDFMIEQQMKTKSLTPAVAPFSETTT